MVFSIGLRFMIVISIISTVRGDILQNVVDKITEEVNKEYNFCRIMLYNRQLVGCDIEPVEDAVPIGTLCTFINDDSGHSSDHVETFLCDEGFLITINHKSTGTRDGHVINKRFFGILFALVNPTTILIGGIVVGVLAATGYFDEDDDPAVPANKPPTIICPQVEGPFYPNVQPTINVYWDAPNATDPEGSHPDVKLESAMHNGSRFGNGSHTIRYAAFDEIGNKGVCSFTFEVNVVNCYYNATSLYVQNGKHVCSTPAIYGTRCAFTCDTGYQLTSTSITAKTCDRAESVGEWQPTTNAVCKKKQCSTPRDQCNGRLVCTDGNNFESVCFPHCNMGYSTDLRNIRCDGDEWVGLNSLQQCTDIEPPEFTICPGTFHSFVSIEGFAIVDWPIPEVTDNSKQSDVCGSGRGVTVLQVSGKSPKAHFEIGYHNITYTAKDSSNNSASCKFTAIVEGLSCVPLVVQDEFLSFKCSNGYSLGSTCSFSCNLNYKLNGDNVTCQQDPNDSNKAFWDWNNTTESYCEKLNCPDLPQPAGGALACSDALGNKICTMSCSNEYQVPKGTVIQYVCNNEHRWIQDLPPNCTVKIHPAFAIKPGELFYYYSGNCSDPGVKEGIQNNFVEEMKKLEATDGWHNICPAYCNVEDVTVTCGPLNGRRRRSISKRSINNELIVNFKVASQWETNKNLWGNDDTLNELGNLIEIEVTNGTFDINGISTGIMKLGWIEFQCPIGQEPVYAADARCVGCPPGKYLQDGDCQKCDKGYFQNTEYQINCTKCPEGKSTHTNGSTSLQDCIDVCPPGAYSSTGLKPCSTCPLGQYQSMYESTLCLICDPLEFTTSTGSKSKTECQVLDLTFFGDEASVKFGSLSMNIESVSTGFFLKCPNTTNTSLIISLGNFKFIVGTETGFAVDEYSYYHSVADEVNFRKWSHITMTFNKNSTEVKMYANGEIIVSSILSNVSSQKADIPIGSYLEIVSAQSGCSVSGLFLVDRVLSEIDITPLKDSCSASVSNPVYSMHNVFTSEMAGIELVPSECDALDECESSPCGNDNVCINKKSGYECQCYGGFTGTSCQIPPDFCLSNDCANGATCISNFANYTCQCLSNYTGLMCETKIVHGNWGSWIDPSDCSVSCGGGLQTRTRYCSDPSPDVFGMDCVGNDTSQIICNTQDCPVCPPFHKVTGYRNSFNCSTNADSIACVVTCKDGFVFLKDFPPLEKYQCGPDTGYTWNVRPPPCASITHPRWLAIRTIATYNVECDNRRQMLTSLSTQLNELQCVHNQTCSKTIEASGCPNTRRKKRSTSLEVTIQLYTDLTQMGDLNLQDFYANNIVSQGLLDLIHGYADMSQSVRQLNSTDILTIDVNGTVYTTDISTLSFIGNISCPEGTILSGLLCVECPVRTYWESGFCVMCPKGFFQDKSKQLSCQPCADGYTTEFIASWNASECIVPYTITTETNPSTLTVGETSPDKVLVTSIVAAVVALFCIVVILVITLIYRKKFSKVLSIAREKSVGSIASINQVGPLHSN